MLEFNDSKPILSQSIGQSVGWSVGQSIDRSQTLMYPKYSKAVAIKIRCGHRVNDDYA